MKVAIALLLTLAVSAPLAAQTRRVAPIDSATPTVVFRPFFVVSAERFTAQETFKAAFGGTIEPMFGGGLEVVLRNGIYMDATVSRFKKTGQRAFFANGQTFPLGIPLTATIIPIEVTGGYRFKLSSWPRLVPYAGAGIGSYGYDETSDFSDPGDDISTRHLGYLAVGGVDVRVHRLVRIAGDVQYTRVTGILGSGGVSKAAGENDLGGIAVRVKVTIGR
jgi:opacity protein-like surface antigen